MTNFFVDLIFPKFCVNCNKFNTLLCEKCFEKINFYPFPLKPEIDECCLENIIVMAEYESIVKKLITTLKYQGIKNIGQTLARMIYYTTNFPRVDMITSVPLHKKRQRQRGFNQATEIALELSKITKIPFTKLLKRTKHSHPQAKISDKNKRLTHLKNTFIINQKILNLKSVLIIDDVTTTGTTLNECAQILKQVGVKKIYGLTVAHGN
ncbi:ComF family protein [Patescibacteria group bacterium]|nr:ComF family protein [Patescibacteria group bacterium]MBU1885067.1 ComF family protein [Patescibacteria group bacterium]